MVIAFESIIIKLKSKSFKGEISFRRIESCNNSFEDKNSTEKSAQNVSGLCPSPVNMTDVLATSLPLEKPIAIKPNKKV